MNNVQFKLNENSNSIKFSRIYLDRVVCGISLSAFFKTTKTFPRFPLPIILTGEILVPLIFSLLNERMLELLSNFNVVPGFIKTV